MACADLFLCRSVKNIFWYLDGDWEGGRAIFRDFSTVSVIFLAAFSNIMGARLLFTCFSTIVKRACLIFVHFKRRITAIGFIARNDSKQRRFMTDITFVPAGALLPPSGKAFRQIFSLQTCSDWFFDVLMTGRCAANECQLNRLVNELWITVYENCKTLRISCYSCVENIVFWKFAKLPEWKSLWFTVSHSALILVHLLYTHCFRLYWLMIRVWKIYLQKWSPFYQRAFSALSPHTTHMRCISFYIHTLVILVINLPWPQSLSTNHIDVTRTVFK